jgi:two-component system, cell cycle response regulator DivK
MDTQLPGVSGHVVAKSIKDDEELKAIPIIAVTTLPMTGHEEVIREAGC